LPPHQRLGLNDRDELQNRRKPSVQLDKEPAIIVREPDAVFTPQNHQLMSKCCIFCFEPAPRLEWRGRDGQEEAEQWEHYPLTLGDSVS
jgi:hypothetical protein